MTVGGHPMRDRVVGRAVFPNFGQGGFTPTDLGEGAETTAAVLRPATLAYGGASGFEFVLLRFADGPGRRGRREPVPALDDRLLLGRPAVHLRGDRPAAERADQLRAHRRHP